MKILMVLDSEFPPDNRVEKEIRTLIEKGHTIYIATYTKERKPKKEIIDGYTVLRKPISELMDKTSVGALKFPFYFNFWRKHLNSILKEEHFDAIHVHDLPLAKVGWEMKVKYHLKFVLDLHENWPAHLRIAKHTNTFLGKLLSSNKQWKKYEKNMAFKADAIITVVEEMKERLIKIGVNKNKLYVLQNFFDLNKTIIRESNDKNKRKEQDKYILIYTGGVTIQRGLQIAIKGLKLARDKEKTKKFKLLIVGDGSYLPIIKHQTDKEGLHDIVEFVGRKTHKELLEYIEKADIGIIPHIKTVQTDNSSPNKLFEYMSKGLPILSSNCDSVERMLMEANCGKSYKHDSPIEFSEKLLEMIEDKEKLKSYSINAKNAVEKKFNWGVAKENLIKLYEAL
jgi:glycosyltransferase involved in cell wall biosynthesis